MNTDNLAERIFYIFQMPLPSDSISERKNGVPSTSIMRHLKSLLDSALGEAHSEGRIEGESAGWRRGSADGFKEAIKTCEERANKWRHENVEEAKTDYRRKVTWDKSHEADDCAEALRAKAKEVG